MIEVKPREIKIEERVKYALSKKVLKDIGWKTKDKISQYADPICPYAISLFNKSLWERASGNKPDMIDMAVKQSEEISKDYNKIEKRYGKKDNPRRKRALNKFNKGRINEEDLKKEQIKFLVTSTNARIKMLNKIKREIKKNGKEFVDLIKNDPEKAIEKVNKLSSNRLKNRDKEIKQAEQNLKKILKNLKKRPITPKPIQKYNK